MEQYSKEVLDHFYNPRNVGEISDADGVGEVGNVRCGDVMHVFIKVGKRPIRQQLPAISNQENPDIENRKLKTDNEEYIEDIKFKTLGCAAAIATSSIMTEMAKGKTLEEAKNISRDDINVHLGILPKQKYHCSILSADGLHKAIKDYEDKKANK